jgi:hypothetical protein
MFDYSVAGSESRWHNDDCFNCSNDDLDWSICTLDIEDPVPFCSTADEAEFDFDLNEKQTSPQKKMKIMGVTRKVVAIIHSDDDIESISHIPDDMVPSLPANNKLQDVFVSANCNDQESKCIRSSSLTRESPSTLSEELKVQIALMENRFISEHLRPYLLRSALSQDLLHQWDKQNGLPASHARTMLRSKRTRNQLLEGLL